MKMKYVILNDAACDKRIKKLGAEVAYFSKEKLDKMYPPNAADTYSVVGYTGFVSSGALSVYTRAPITTSSARHRRMTGSSRRFKMTTYLLAPRQAYPSFLYSK